MPVPRPTRSRNKCGGNLKHDDITRLLRASRDGDAAALDELLPLVYQELRRGARRAALTVRVTLRSAMTLDPALDAEVRSLVDEYRERCLWFVRSDYYPSTPDEILRVLRWIRARGDREAFQRAGKIEEWLSRTSSEKSAAS